MSVLEAQALSKTYVGGDGGLITVLDCVDLHVDRGEMVAIVGASGAGKSTLLHLLGALDRPSSGRVLVDGQALEGMDDDAVCRLAEPHGRLRVSVSSPAARVHGAGERDDAAAASPERTRRRARDRATALLERVGLGGRVHHRPGALSGGEQQRTAVARALAADPAVLLADEPSGNLDHTNSERLHELFAELARELELGMVVVTHNRSLAARADRVLLLEDGRLTQVDRAGGSGLMLCDNCHERDAVVNLTTIESNAVRQLHLCEQCAAERGVETSVATPEASARASSSRPCSSSPCQRAPTRASAPSAVSP